MTAQPPSTPTVTRPLGVTILALVSGIFGVLGLLASLTLFGLSGLIGTVGGASLAGQSTISSVIGLATAVLALAFAYGAWNLKPWAWPLGLAFAAFAVVSAVASIVDGADFGGAIIGLVIAGAVAYYLMTPQVKAAFGRA